MTTRAGLRRQGGAAWVWLLVCPLAPAIAGELVEGEAQADGIAEVDGGYRFRVERCASALRSEWRSARGDLVAWDEAQLADGQLLRYRLVRPNLGQDFMRSATDGGTADGLPLLAGPMLIEHARSRLAVLRAGEALRVRYLIAETGMMLPLRLRATGRTAVSTSVTVEAAQAWLRPLVPRATLEFDAAGRFVGMRGQILPQAGSGQHPKPIAARVRVLATGPTSGCHNSQVFFTRQ